MSCRKVAQRLYASIPLSSVEQWLRTGMTIEFLGTSSARPTKFRNVSSLVLHHSSGSFMFDCGDGTLRQLLCSSISRLTRIEAIFITHLHCDHFYGLPAVGVALAEGANDEYEQRASRAIKKKVFGPRGLARLVGAMVGRNMDIVEIGLRGNIKGQHYDSSLPFSSHIVYENSELQIGAIQIKHSVTCFGYVVKERAKRNIDSLKVQEKYGLVPGPLYRRLLNMETVESPTTGVQIDPHDVVSETPGRTIVILGDTYDPSSTVSYAKDCDLLVHEATGVEIDRTHILQTGHSTGGMAGAFARSIGAKQLVLNHFSPRQVINGIPCDEATYQRHILREAKEAAGRDVLVTASYDHFALPIPRTTDSIVKSLLLV